MRILLVEDDQETGMAILAQLEKDGYTADFCIDGLDALYYVKKEGYDAIILDRMLPGMDGLEVLQSIRKNNIHTPVIMATAMSDISDRIDGLDCGADDYIPKPYDIHELVARIRALTRRPCTLSDPVRIIFEDLTLLTDERKILCQQSEFHLSKKETLLLEYFLKNPNKTLARDTIFNHVWGIDSLVENNNLDNYVHFLRKRLRALKSNTEIITVHCAGYKLQKKEG